VVADLKSGKKGMKKSGFLRYFGPALIVSVAYFDPGNFGTDIAAGASFNYDLLWVVWLASFMAMLLQYLSGKLGIATGRSLAELAREKLSSRWRVIAYWLACEAFAVATDLAEFLGVTVALSLLLGIPTVWAALMASFDVLLIFALAGKKFRRIEMLVAGLVFIVSLGYVYEVFVTKPDFAAMTYHSAVPFATAGSIAISVGIIGATVMPHALVVHSWLTKNKLEKGDAEEKRKLLRYHLWDTVTNLSGAALINVAILVMAAAAFFGSHMAVVTMQDAYLTLTPLFGALSGIVFAITLLCSGLSSSTTGVLAGQAIMEGLLGSNVHPWLRRVVLRGINVFPTMVALFFGLNILDLLVYSQVVLSLLIPLPMIPLIYFTGKRSYMGEFVNRKITTAMALAFGAIILTFNVYLLISSL
jgi:manganese transport protein